MNKKVYSEKGKISLTLHKKCVTFDIFIQFWFCQGCNYHSARHSSLFIDGCGIGHPREDMPCRMSPEGGSRVMSPEGGTE